MKKRNEVIIILSLITFAAIVLAVPETIFVDPTPTSSIITSNTSLQINASITEANLDSVVYNWNGTNYTFFNNSLVLMMNFNNVSDLGENVTHIFDISGSGNNGTISGAVYNLSGKYGSSVQFDGSNDYASAADANSLDFGTGGFSFNFWFNVNGLPSSGSAQLIVKRLSGGGNTELQLSSGVIESYIEGTGQSTRNLKSTYNVTNRLGQWIFVTLNRNSGTAAIYVNGVQNVSGSSVHNVNNAVALHIGADYDGVNPRGEFFNGSIDNLMIFNRSLSDQEIYQLYASTLQKHNTTYWSLYVNQSQNTVLLLFD